MAIKTIEYTVDIAGVTPVAEQFAGTQGDHRVAEIVFTISDALYSAIAAAAEDGKVLYRFDIYDGEGGVWSSDAAELVDNTISIELEERHTRYGGKITVYLVITALSSDNETEIELYSFPARLRLNNKPCGITQDGENYESITGLAEVAKAMADDAALSASAAESSNKELQEFAAEIEEKLKNGDFDGLGVKNAEIINDELIITYTDNTSQNLGNVKGDKGDTGPQGEKGDEGTAGKDAIIDQTYNAESENAQSGIAVAAAINGRMPKPILLPGAPIKTVSVMGHDDYTTITDPDNHAEVFIVNDSAFKDIIVDDGTVWGKANVSAANGCIPTRDENGNLWTGTPIDDQDCVNKKFVAEALNPYVKKVKGNGHSVQVYAVGNSDNLYDERMLIVEDNGVFEAGVEYGQIPYRQSNGNLMTNTPAKDLDCANKAYVDAAVANLEGLKVVIVSALPETGESDTLYFVPATDTQEQNLYDEYIYANDAWEKIGSAAVEVDLTDYVKNTDYASSAKYGVVCVSETYGSGVIAGGTLCGINRSYEQYKNVNGYHLISKYILENVLSERVDKPLGDIESALDELHNYAQALINGGAE